MSQILALVTMLSFLTVVIVLCYVGEWLLSKEINAEMLGNLGVNFTMQLANDSDIEVVSPQIIWNASALEDLSLLPIYLCI